MKYVVVGGVAGGATAAARMRRDDEKAEIILFEKGEYISYANCGLPYYIGGVIEDRNKLFVVKPAQFSKRFNLDIRTRSEVLSIDKEKKMVSVKGADGNVYSETYDKLLLSPGAVPVVPPLKGIENEGIFTLRNVTDADTIRQYITGHQIKSAIVVGAGFIGLEMAENLHAAGAKVSIVEMLPQVMAPVDFSIAAIMHEHLLQKGVDLYLEKAVTEFQKTSDGINVLLKSGESIPTDMVILSIGVRPNTKLATDAGLEIGAARGIKVNEFLQTSDANIYAVGDAIEYPHPLTGKPWLNYLAGPANRQGRIVADNMTLGNKVTYEGAIGTAIAQVFDLAIATTGLPAKRLKADGIPFLSDTIHGMSHAGYYPDATPLTIKLTFDPTTGKLYGGQAIGACGADTRIDEIARVIKNNGTVYDLIKLEQAYAPPFSSAKDPAAVAAYVATNIIAGKLRPLYWYEIKDADLSKVTLVDVRTQTEYALGHIGDALNIPVDDIRERMNEIPQDKPIWLYCGSGLRSYLAGLVLDQNGFKDVKSLIGGYRTYKTSTAKMTIPVSIPSSSSPKAAAVSSSSSFKTIKVDACGMSCPGPILQLKKGVDSIQNDDILEVTSTDPGFPNDAKAWCETTGNKFISCTSDKGKFIVSIQKEPKEVSTLQSPSVEQGKTFILFSDDLDKALATFILANGAAATGAKVSIFFTFWGLNAIKKVSKPEVKKDLFGKMFGMMLPSSSLKLKLSKMNMGGIGAKMMRYIMKRKDIDSLEQLRAEAIESGVEFIACQMSMDVMGIKKEELLDNITIGGVATYMNRADKSNVNLFI